MDKNWNLPKVREKLSNLIKNDFLFLLQDGFIINHIEEEIFSLASSTLIFALSILLSLWFNQ